MSNLSLKQFLEIKFKTDRIKYIVRDALRSVFPKRIPWKKIYNDLYPVDGFNFDIDQWQTFRKNITRSEPSADRSDFLILVYWLYNGTLRTPKKQEVYRKKADEICIDIFGCTIDDHYKKFTQKLIIPEKPATERPPPTNTGSKPSPNAKDYEQTNQPPLWLPDSDYLNHDKSNWLNPSVINALPFQGRVEELKQLTDFATSESNFQVWALSGPSGAGKTRLITKWMRDFESKQNNSENSQHQWNIGFLDQRTQATWKNNWETWIPEKPTFIVIDYIYKSQEIIDQLINRWRPPNDEKLPFPVRLLLIDHIFPQNLENLLDDPRFRSISSGGVDWENKKKLFFSNTPLELDSETHSKEHLSAIMESAAYLFGAKLNENAIKDGLNELETTTAAWCPLFAALKGYAFAKDAKSKFGDRRDLIKFYLNTTNRLPWFADNDEEKAIGLAVGCFVSVATLLHNTTFQNLISVFSQQDLTKGDLSEQLKLIIIRSCWIVSNSDKTMLYAFEPDILGESFFLEFYHHIKYPIDRSSTFIKLLCQAGNDEDKYNKAHEFIEFFARISRNLENDNQQDPKIKLYWEMFLDFLNHQDFLEDTPIRQAVSIVLVNVIQSLEKCGHDELAKTCLPE